MSGSKSVVALFTGIARRGSVLNGRGSDLNLRQVAVLAHIVEQPGVHTVRGLAAVLNVQRPSITRIIDKLEAENLVKRADDPRDRRSVVMQPLPDGVTWVNTVAASILHCSHGYPGVRTPYPQLEPCRHCRSAQGAEMSA